MSRPAARLRWRPASACPARLPWVIFQQRVHLRRGVVGQQRGQDGAGRLRVLRCPCAVVFQQRVHLRQGVVGQQRSREGRVRRCDGVAVCRNAQRVVAVGQRSRERSPQMQVANDVASANKLPSREARPGRRVNNSALPESCRAASSARIASRALWSVVLGKADASALASLLSGGRVGHAAEGRHQDSKCPAGSRHRGLCRSAAC